MSENKISLNTILTLGFIAIFSVLLAINLIFKDILGDNLTPILMMGLGYFVGYYAFRGLRILGNK
ncbi:hypothetical protein [Zunongwangia profunda]|jgi:hypothetical protein|uniref:Uncharacterized protein n=2 Tax=Zunongwangia profunda TaxID=398743 RepID=D5BCJ2_ZUNPS|nr:hypothetical protein [Zunongwangia profunda]ADF50505.1 hypothetical protein ZPR_0142 [Zunongwangia profunda SM-A87]MAS70583.1 hypothetical protein [Zunongwangia sp.]MCC4230505.1 hypothetical protein [Zunongwangia profunda]HAJ82239.1 hypothetical protein [Zunongwangia profunda]|tara:strand:- start:43 stop:237 length:195 start_codon:yes stop_codon:yes gene_type:complete